VGVEGRLMEVRRVYAGNQRRNGVGVGKSRGWEWGFKKQTKLYFRRHYEKFSVSRMMSKTMLGKTVCLSRRIIK